MNTDLQELKARALLGDANAVLEIATLVETLTRDLAGAHQGLRLAQEVAVPRVASNSVSATIDSDEFRELEDIYISLAIDASSPTSFDMYSGRLNVARSALIDYIDERIAAAGMEDKRQWISVDERMPETYVYNAVPEGSTKPAKTQQENK